jgi:hypothetical protein
MFMREWRKRQVGWRRARTPPVARGPSGHRTAWDRVRQGAAIFSSIVLSAMLLTSCISTSGMRDARPGGQSGRTMLDRPLGPLLRQALVSLRAEPSLCRETLRDRGVRAVALVEVHPSGGCSLENGVSYRGDRTRLSQDARITCPMAAAMSAWEQQIVAPAAQRHFRSNVKLVEVLSAYSCRTRYSRPGAPISEHGKGDAIDVGGFRLSNGRVISVEHGWRGDRDEAAFLREVRDRSCEVFNAVLSPDYNAAHYNHLHFDLGRDRLCR